MISSSSYPKNIYNMPLVEKELKIQFEFEFKFKFELKQKRKEKKKRKRNGHNPLGLASAKGPASLLHGPPGLSPHGREERNRKKEKGRAPLDLAHGHLHLHGPGDRACFLNFA